MNLFIYTIYIYIIVKYTYAYTSYMTSYLPAIVYHLKQVMRNSLVKQRLPEFQEEAKAPCGPLVTGGDQVNPFRTHQDPSFIGESSEPHESDPYGVYCICRLWWFKPSQSYVPSAGQSPKTEAIRLEGSHFLGVGRMSGTSTIIFSCHFFSP